MQVQIKSILGSIIFEGFFSSTKEAVFAAVKSNTDLRGANLRDANLLGANLRGANLRDVNLRDANLREIKADFLAAIAKLPNEVPNLRAAIVAGKIDGSTYKGDCACLAGTIANHLECNYTELPEKGFSVNAESPRERWFLGINEGDTPENSQISAITLEWVDEFLSTNNLVDSGK